MMKTLLALGAAAVAVTAVPAQSHNRHHGRTCVKMRHGHCVRWNNHGYTVSTARHARYKVGYVFGPSYTYVPVAQLPQTYVQRYDLGPDYRYVYRDNYIYVVDPTTYAVTRVINALTGR